MAVTNNIGAECLLYKGGIVKSFNQYYNRKVSKIMSEEMNKPSCPKNKDGNPKFVPTEQYHNTFNEITKSKTSCGSLPLHCLVRGRIDTIVLGVNKYWKQEVNMGHITRISYKSHSHICEALFLIRLLNIVSASLRRRNHIHRKHHSLIMMRYPFIKKAMIQSIHSPEIESRLIIKVCTRRVAWFVYRF